MVGLALVLIAITTFSYYTVWTLITVSPALLAPTHSY